MMAQVHFMLANGIQMLLRARVIFILSRHLAAELKREFAREQEGKRCMGRIGMNYYCTECKCVPVKPRRLSGSALT